MRTTGFVSIGLIAFSAQCATPLIRREIRETKPLYRIAVAYPELNSHPSFNSAMRQIIDPVVAGFRRAIAQPAPKGAPAFQAYLEAKYTAASLRSGVVSVLMTWQQFTPGQAHPSEGMASVNYDVRTRRILTLSDLFRPNSDYAARLSQLAIDSLMRRKGANRDLILPGAGPSASNFKIFTLTDSALVLHFPTYQVGTRVDGPQEVTIPLNRLRTLLIRPRL